MKIKLTLFLLLSILGGMVFSSTEDSQEITGKTTALITEWSQHLYHFFKERDCVPVLAHGYTGATVKMAYQVQTRVLKERFKSGGEFAGLKAGITSVHLQKRFGLSEPVFGVLLTDGERSGGSRLDAKEFKKLMLETEIGFVIGTAITSPPADVGELRSHIRAIMPVIECPDLCFDNLSKLSPLDIIAGNVSAGAFIVGKTVPLGKQDLNGISVVLTRNGNAVNSGSGSDCMGDQWKTVLWLVNRAISQGWQLKPGHILITGAMGKMIPGKPGDYSADYGEFGTIRFSIR